MSSDEIEWMTRVGEGDVDAFERFVERFWSGTLLYVAQIADDFDVAEDDSRVNVEYRGHDVSDGSMEAWYVIDKHSTSDAPQRMASWEEAQLIIAEARLGQEAVDRINALRQSHDLPLNSPNNVADDDEILDQVIEERRREFFMEGRWLNDMIRQRGRDAIQWREGLNSHGNLTYGAVYCIPLPDRERQNNPNL